jgi:cysteine desulfurase
MKRERVYLDWNATTPLRPEAKAAMVAGWDISGNPSSIHSEGRAARKLIEDARTAIAQVLGTRGRNVVFTSGGTEANALALTPGIRNSAGVPLARLIMSSIEHPSVLAGGRFLPNQIERIAVTEDGVLDLKHLQALLAAGPPALVSVMLANNETGVIQPIHDIACLVHAAGGVLHVDAIQALGRIPVSIGGLGADLMTLSSHKIGGPKGVGALVLHDELGFAGALIRGGGQEQNRRAGTENVQGIAGFGAAASVVLAEMGREAAHMLRFRERLEAGLKGFPGTVIFGEKSHRLPNTILCAFPGLQAETAVIALDLEGIAISSGSACSSGKVTRSHVLDAMGVEPLLAQGALRLSIGWNTTESEIDRALEAWRKLPTVLGRG